MEISYDKTIEVTLDLDVEKTAEALVEYYKKEFPDDSLEYIYNDIDVNLFYYMSKLGIITEEQYNEIEENEYNYGMKNFIKAVEDYIDNKYGF